jgi:hypothetical protein
MRQRREGRGGDDSQASTPHPNPRPQGERERAAVAGAATSFRDGALAPDPESRDSGFDASHRPGMTAGMDLPSLSDDVSRHFSLNARINWSLSGLIR